MLQFPLKRFVKDGWHEGIQFGGSFGLQALEALSQDPCKIVQHNPPKPYTEGVKLATLRLVSRSLTQNAQKALRE